MSKNRILFCVALVATILSVFSLISTNRTGLLDTKADVNEGTWVHYKSIDPTATTGGIKEYYVNCNSHLHTFEKPQSFIEGTLSETQKNEIFNLKDDRYVKSFNELDGMLDGANGDNAFDFVNIKKTENYYNTNYSDTAKSNYNGKLFSIKTNYNSTFNQVYNASEMKFTNYSGSDYFSNLNQVEDSEYGPLSEFSIVKTGGTYRSTVWNGDLLQPVSTLYSEISFALYTSKTVNLLVDIYPSKTDVYLNKGNTTLYPGWTIINVKSGTSEYDALTSFVSDKDTILRFRTGNTCNEGTDIKITSFYGKSSVAAINRHIAELPSVADLKSYHISKINAVVNEYNSLTDSQKKIVVNYAKVEALLSEWNNNFIMLYDVNESYANWADSNKLTQSVIDDETYGKAKSVTVKEAMTGISMANAKNAYKENLIDSIVFYVNPSIDSRLCFSGIGNYGVLGEKFTQTANTWNEFEIKTDYISNFMSYFKNNDYVSTNFVSTNSADTWDATKNRTNTVGFNFKITSFIGVLSKGKASDVVKLINELPLETSVSLSTAPKLFEIENQFDSLSFKEKENVINIDKYYSIKTAFNNLYGYVLSPDLDINCYQYAADGTKDIVLAEKNIPSPYGPCYRYKTKSTLSGSTWPTYRFEPGEINYEGEGAVIFGKGFTSKLAISINEYNQYVAQSIGPVSIGDGWYKWELNKEQLNAFMSYDTYCFYKDNNGLKADVEYMFTGLYLIKSSTKNEQSISDVQTMIDNIDENEALNEYSNVKISKISQAISSLNSREQSELKGTSKINNLYSKYNKKYEKVFSYNIYKAGIPWNGTASNFVKNENDDYGTTIGFTNPANYTVITLGTWKTNLKYDGSSNQYRGQGTPLKPLEYGKYTQVSLKVYSPFATNIGFNARLSGDTGYSILYTPLSVGWNDITFTGDSLKKLCGYDGDTYKGFEGLQISLGTLASSSSSWIFTEFIATKDSTFTGEQYHYAIDSTHENAYNINSKDIKLFENGSSTYRISAILDSKTSICVSLIEKGLRKSIGASLNIYSDLKYSSKDRIIFINDLTQMAAAGLSEPTEEEIGESGYIIKTVGESIFIYSLTKNGYKNAATKFLSSAIGLDQLGKDQFVVESNGYRFENNMCVNLPDFNIVEKPDYAIRLGSNANHNNTSFNDDMGFDYFNFLMTKDEEGNTIQSYHNIQNYLPRSTYPNYYWHDSTKTGWGEDYEYQFCYTLKGDSANYLHAIDTISNRIISMAKANPDKNYATVGQADCNGHCDCTACKEIYNQHGGSYSSCVIKFMNDLDNAIKAKYTSREINLLFFAYHQTLSVPTNKTPDMELHDNIGVMVAPSKARWVRSFYDDENSTAAGNYGAKSGLKYSYDNDFASKVNAWNEFATFKYIWAYQTNFSHQLYFYNTFDTMVDQYRFFYHAKAQIMANEGNWLDNGSGFTTFKDYLDAKILYDVNSNYDQIYEKFFKYYYGDAGENMKCLFEEELNNSNYCLERYGLKNEYNPNSSDYNLGKKYYTGGVSFTMNKTTYLDGNNNVYNGGSTTNSQNNIANLTRWTNYIENSLTTVLSDNVLYGHVRVEALSMYIAQHEILGSNEYDLRLAQDSYLSGTYYLSESDQKDDRELGLNWKNGKKTICYLMTGKTYSEKFDIK